MEDDIREIKTALKNISFVMWLMFVIMWLRFFIFNEFWFK